MSDPLYLDPKTGQYYRKRKDKYGRDVAQFVPEEPQGEPSRHTAPPKENRREQDARHRHNSVHASTSRPTTASTTRAQTRRDSIQVSGGSTKDSYGEGESYSPSDSKRPYQRESSSKYHDRGGYSSSSRPTYEASSSHDAYRGNDEYTGPAQVTGGHGAGDTLGDGIRGMSIHDDSAYVPGPGPPSLSQYSTHTTYTSDYADPQDPYERAGESSSVIPQQAQSSPKKHHAAPTRGPSQKLDKSYRTRNYDYKKFFQVGRVFQTLWSEPWTSTTGNDAQNSSVSSIIHDEKVYSKVRIFVVVRYHSEGTSCTCLTVTTYSKRGLDKPGINLSEHGFIYSHNKPRAFDGIEKTPLRVILSRGAEDIKELSLVNYAGVQTLQTNIKVKDIGELDGSSKEKLRRYWTATMAQSDSAMQESVTDQTPRTQPVDFAGMGAGMASPVPVGSYDHPTSQPTYTSYSTPLPLSNSSSSAPAYDPHYSLRTNPIGPNTYDAVPNSSFNSSSATPFHANTNRSSYYPASSENTTYATYDTAGTSQYPSSVQYSSGASPSYDQSQGYSSNQPYRGNAASSNSSYFPYSSAGGSQSQATYREVPRSYENPTGYYPTQDYGGAYSNEAAFPEQQEIPLATLEEANASRASRPPRERRRR